MDYTTLITSEHSTRPNFVALVDKLCNGVGAVTSLLQSMPSLFDLDAAVGDQLDILGLWIGQSRNIPNGIAINYFGFSDNVNAATFGEVGTPSVGGPFYDLGGATGTSALLDDSTYRTVLKAKILANQYDGSIGQLESAITEILGFLPVVNLIQDSGVTGGWTYWSYYGLQVAQTTTLGVEGFQFPGSGVPVSFEYARSSVITVTPGETYTISGYIDATHVIGAPDPVWWILDPTATINYGGASQAAGQAGRVTYSFTVPAGVTQIIVAPDTNNCTIANGQYVYFAEPQLELGSSASAYQQTNQFSIIDPGTLLVTLVMNSAVSSVTRALLTSLDLMPRAAGVKYLPLFPLASWTWSTVGTVTTTSNSVTKSSGVPGWDSCAYDAATSSPVYTEWKPALPNVSGAWAAGLSSNPSASPSYTSLNYGFYTPSAATLQIVESGTIVGTFGTYAGGDRLAVYSDGVNVVYLHNGAVLRVTPVAAGSYSPMFCFYTVSDSATNIAIATS